MAGNSLSLFPRACGALARLLGACLSRISVEGLENVPRLGPALFVCNHCSNVDGIVLIGYLVPAMRRPTVWLGKEEALRWPILGWAVRQNGVVGVRRGGGDLEVFRLARSVLDGGRVLTIFPEGTRSRTGALQTAKDGATLLAVRSGAPVVPVAIIGSQRFWPRGKLLPRPFRRMTMRVGEPFTLQMPDAPDRHEALQLATAELMGRIAALLPAEQRGVYEPRGTGGAILGGDG